MGLGSTVTPLRRWMVCSALLCVEEVYLKRSLMETRGCPSFMWIRAACLSLALGAEVLNVVCLSTATKAALFEASPPN